MSNPSALGAVTSATETTFGEDNTTIAGFRWPITSPVDCSGLVHNKVDSNRVVQYRNDGTPWILATQGGSFKTKCYLPGHGSSTSGATTITTYETNLGYVFGAAVTSAASGTTFTGAGTASAPTTTASGTFAAGSLCFAGALADGRGGGQCYAVSTHAATTLNLLTGLILAPSAADALFAATTISTLENPTSTTFQSLRFLLQTANLQYECHGCWPTAVSITGLNPGELPMIEITWAVAWWRYSTATFPNTTATDTSNPGAVAGGSLQVNTVGTATNAPRTFRNFTINYTLGSETLRGPGGVNQYQDIVGCRRTPDKINVSWTEDADANTTTPVLAGYGTATNRKHLMYTSSTGAGSRIGIYFPTVDITNVAVQKMDQNLNRLTITADAACSSTTTSDLTLSAFRMAFG